jgi:hypothetical protein
MLEDGAALLGTVATIALHLERSSVARLKAKIDIEYVQKTTQQQARANKQYTSQRYL